MQPANSPLAASSYGGLYTSRTVSDADSDRSSLEAKTQRLAAAKERQRTLRRHGAAAGILLQLTLQRSCLMCRAIQLWRALPSLAAQRKALESSLTSRHDLASPQIRASPQPAPAPVQQPQGADVAALRAELAGAASLQAHTAARAAAERQLLRHELDAEWGERLVNLEKDHQSALVRCARPSKSSWQAYWLDSPLDST